MQPDQLLGHDDGVAVDDLGELALIKLRPNLTSIVAFKFDRQFVISNGDFLVKTLLDRFLQLELVNALEVATALKEQDAGTRATKNAKLALQYLFDEPNMFKVKPVSQDASFPDIDANVVDTSFDASQQKNALDDAVGNKQSIIFLF